MALHQNGDAGQPPVLRVALALAQRNLHVFPCKRGSKVPATEHGCLDATIGLARIAMWWHHDPTLNLAIATGEASGLWTIDSDVDKETGARVGDATLSELEARHGPLPPTVEVITPRGGRHLYYAWPSDREVRNSTSQLGPCLDVRGAGGYVLAPPSVVSGKRYQWSIDSAPRIAAAAAWLLDLVCAPANGKAKKAFTAPPTDWAAQLRDGITEPGRNDFCTRLTGMLLRHHIDPHAVRELVVAFGLARCRPPLDPAEVDKIVNSVAAAEMRKRQCRTT